MLNHAFLIMAYNNPELLARTIRLLECDNHYFFVHIDKKADLEPFRLSLNGIKNMVLLSDNERIIVNWGGGITVVSRNCSAQEITFMQGCNY